MAASSHGQRHLPLAARRSRRSPRRLLRLLLLGALALLARPFARRPAGPPRKILYVKPDHLGDLLLATPALAALRQRFPEAQISALVGPWARAVLARNPDIDRLLTYPFPGFARAGDQQPTKDEGRRTNEPPRPTKDQRPTTNGRRRSALGSRRSVLNSQFSILNSARPWWELLRFGLLLRSAGYDLALIGRDDHWWGAALALLAGVPRRAGFAVPECRPFLSTALPWRPDDHVTVQGLALVETVAEDQRPTSEPRGVWGGSPPDLPSFTLSGRPLAEQHDFSIRNSQFSIPLAEQHDFSIRNSQFSIPLAEQHNFSILTSHFSIPKARFDPEPGDLAWADEWLARGLAGAGKLVVIHPGTGGPAKLWPAERWAAVADALAARGDVRLLLTGGPGEEALVAAVRAEMRAPAPSLAGQTSLGQLAALLRRADLVLGVDSGPLYLAAAQGTPTVHLYGPGDERRFGPWGDPARHVVLRTALWCSPCGVFGACPRGLALPECMERIGTAAVLEAARAALDP